jgi:hypothetical protein
MILRRRKNDPLDFVALMEAQSGEQPPAPPEFELLPRGKAKRAKRARPAAKTLLPEDHHYKVGHGRRAGSLQCVT